MNQSIKNDVICTVVNKLAEDIHETARQKGWWDNDRNSGECIALMMSELAEGLESLRHGEPPDEHCPEFGNTEIELADCIIRILDFANARGYDIGGALVAKMEYNKTREYKHGGKKF